mmetsp:Transcript_89317/g.124059  ORF Transcript_89317/g.124059 Transcript_89317/m.124059 type:complete len:261 (-) Transcript_89317:275-1057(-)
MARPDQCGERAKDPLHAQRRPRSSREVLWFPCLQAAPCSAGWPLRLHAHFSEPAQARKGHRRGRVSTQNELRVSHRRTCSANTTLPPATAQKWLRQQRSTGGNEQHLVSHRSPLPLSQLPRHGPWFGHHRGSRARTPPLKQSHLDLHPSTGSWAATLRQRLGCSSSPRRPTTPRATRARKPLLALPGLLRELPKPGWHFGTPSAPNDSRLGPAIEHLPRGTHGSQQAAKSIPGLFRKCRPGAPWRCRCLRSSQKIASLEP